MSIPSWAVKGAKVVCVDASLHPLIGTRLVKGGVYTIDNVYLWQGEIPCVEVAEAKSAHPTKGFRLSRFRPVTTRTQEQDIAEHFAQHLKTREPV